MPHNNEHIHQSIANSVNGMYDSAYTEEDIHSILDEDPGTAQKYPNYVIAAVESLAQQLDLI